jgi:hypothetical protein
MNNRAPQPKRSRTTDTPTTSQPLYRSNPTTPINQLQQIPPQQQQQQVKPQIQPQQNTPPVPADNTIKVTNYKTHKVVAKYCFVIG